LAFYVKLLRRHFSNKEYNNSKNFYSIGYFKDAQRVNLWNNENSLGPVYPNDITIFKEI